jgi:hypothetical protein
MSLNWRPTIVNGLNAPSECCSFRTTTMPAVLRLACVAFSPLQVNTTMIFVFSIARWPFIGFELRSVCRTYKRHLGLVDTYLAPGASLISEDSVCCFVWA